MLGVRCGGSLVQPCPICSAPPVPGQDHAARAGFCRAAGGLCPSVLSHPLVAPGSRLHPLRARQRARVLCTLSLPPHQQPQLPPVSVLPPSRSPPVPPSPQCRCVRVPVSVLECPWCPWRAVGVNTKQSNPRGVCKRPYPGCCEITPAPLLPPELGGAPAAVGRDGRVGCRQSGGARNKTWFLPVPGCVVCRGGTGRPWGVRGWEMGRRGVALGFPAGLGRQPHGQHGEKGREQLCPTPWGRSQARRAGSLLTPSPGAAGLAPGWGQWHQPPPGQHRRGFVLGAVPAPSVPCSFLQPAALGTMARGRAKAAREQRASPEGRGHRAPLSCLLGTAPRGGLRAQQCLGFVAPGMLARPHVHPPGAWLLPKVCGWAGAGALLAKQPGRVTPAR